MEDTRKIGAFESRPPGLVSRLIHRLADGVLTEGGDEVVAENDAPDWSVRDVIYNRWQGKRFLRRKVVAMVFCGTWCVPCQWEVQTWKELHRDYALKGLRIVGLFADYPDDIRAFVASFQLTTVYPCARASDKILWDYGVYPTGQIPVCAIVDRDGRLMNTWTGYRAKSTYEQAIVSLL